MSELSAWSTKGISLEFEALKYVAGLLQVMVSAWCWVLYTDLKAAKAANELVSKDLASHRLHTAETYMTKSESTRAYDSLSKNLDSLLVTMNSRFDKMDSKLDSKMDKGD